MSVCLKCGLPKELCTCSQLVLEEQVAKIEHIKRKFGKEVTIIRGINFDDLGNEAVKELIKTLKKKLACGGTFDKENKWIELQGTHKDGVKKILIEQGFNVEGHDKNNGVNGEKSEGDKIKQ
jgi:translation initiation factor 1